MDGLGQLPEVLGTSQPLEAARAFNAVQGLQRLSRRFPRRCPRRYPGRPPGLPSPCFQACSGPCQGIHKAQPAPRPSEALPSKAFQGSPNACPTPHSPPPFRMSSKACEFIPFKGPPKALKGKHSKGISTAFWWPFEKAFFQRSAKAIPRPCSRPWPFDAFSVALPKCEEGLSAG